MFLLKLAVDKPSQTGNDGKPEEESKKDILPRDGKEVTKPTEPAVDKPSQTDNAGKPEEESKKDILPRDGKEVTKPTEPVFVEESPRNSFNVHLFGNPIDEGIISAPSFNLPAWLQNEIRYKECFQIHLDEKAKQARETNKKKNREDIETEKMNDRDISFEPDI
ncbi:unnamed protein product [Schistosoma turkestanicum]|nr:unnamed protein product [Schistosoma turkestanicum]